MNDDRDLVDQLQRLLGAPPEVQVPATLDDRVLGFARHALQPAPVRPRRAGPPALAWVGAIGAILVVVAVWLAWPLHVALPNTPSPLAYGLAAGYLLTLLSSSLLLIRRRNGGIGHGEPH